jgi:hypothetical protein
MRKHEQQQILELLRTIEQAQAAGLFAGCREGALSIGSFIESVEGADNPRIASVIALLSEYCDLLCAASKGEASEKRLRRQLIEIENRVRSELTPDRIEVVFLPYQLSMFDALESVYRAAAADPACDARVVPIPWYELNPGGSLGRLRCDGDEYPADIPVTDYRAYDIEARRPDAIFVHNPYDGGNLVTRVHEDFYCERLRGLTELLVYIPYFVTYGEVPEHFCATAGCVYAHRVILQSEAVRDTYVRVFKAAYGDSFGKPEEKFLALGSPKFDKVLSTRREDCALPERWRRLIAGRKTVLYNTSVGALLAGDTQYLTKLKHVLGTFKNRGDIALWWRPHPLNEATCKSIRPGLLKAYKKIVAEYRLEGAGIYDDTQDLHRAVARTDAYYGDPSSLAALYGMTGKPIMIQDANVLPGGEREDALLFESCYDNGTHIWFAAYFFNGLFRCDKETWTAEYLGAFPEEKPDGIRLFGGVAECGGKLYFAPMSAERIAVYDTESGAFERFDVSTIYAKMEYASIAKFSCALQCGEWIVFLPAYYSAVARMNLRTRELEYLTDWIEDVEALRNSSHSYFAKFAGIAFDDKLQAVLLCADAVLTVDGSTGKTCVSRLGTGNKGHLGICHDGRDLWLTPVCDAGAKAHVIRWDGTTAEPVDLAAQGHVSKEYADSEIVCFFSGIICVDKKLWILPFYWDCGFKIDLESGAKSVCDAFACEYKSQKAAKGPFLVYSFFWPCNNTINALSAKSGKLISLNTQTANAEEHSIAFDFQHIDIITKEPKCCRRLDECLYFDTDFHGMTDFLDLVSRDGDSVRDIRASLAKALYSPNEPVSGTRIYDYCKSMVLG